MSITKSQFDYLIGIDKAFENLDPIELGPPPINWCRKINAVVGHDAFLLDFYRGRFELKKYTFNSRYRQATILFRYDAQGTHTNPDGVTFNGPHVHFFKEGYDDKFAYQISEIGVLESDTINIVLVKLLKYFNVISHPPIIVPLF